MFAKFFTVESEPTLYIYTAFYSSTENLDNSKYLKFLAADTKQ